MKYAIIQVEEQYFFSSDVYRTDVNTTYVTRPVFRMHGEFDTIEEPIELRKSYEHPEWFKIIQVW